MRRPALALPALGLALVLSLTACSGGDDEATRDDSGAVATEGAVDAFDVEVGDCVLAPSGAEESAETQEIEELEAVPCEQSHDGEVYAQFDLPDGDYPGDEQVSVAGDDRCISEFATFVGIAYEESKYDFTTLFPTKDSWEQLDDREVICIAVDPEAQLTGSLEGAAE